MPDRLRFALFGSGDFGPQFASYINECAEVVAVCDPSSEARKRFSEQTGMKVASFSDPQTLLDSVDIDSVAIASSARPYSRAGAPATSPPQWAQATCMP